MVSSSQEFAIVDECFPYIARRMLSDDSPRMREALRTFIYGNGDRINLTKVSRAVFFDVIAQFRGLGFRV